VRIEREGAASDELTSVRLAISEPGRPLRVKRAAKTGELRWRIRVKSKGTRGGAAEILVTANEVEHARVHRDCIALADPRCLDGLEGHSVAVVDHLIRPSADIPVDPQNESEPRLRPRRRNS
jgi:hypothetical protein